MTWQEAADRIVPPQAGAQRQAQARWDTLAKLPGSLGALEEAVSRLAGIQGSADPCLDQKLALVLCADNGVVAQGVTPSAMAVTAAQAVNFARGGGVINAFARRAGADVRVVDVGIACPYTEPAVLDRAVRRGTGDIASGPAMTAAECRATVEAGIGLARDAAAEGCRLVIVGEMGIGNTTTASAVAAVLLGCDVQEVTAKGAGTCERVAHKAAVLRRALAVNRPDPADPLDVLAKVGGLDLAAMCGVYLGCAAAGVAAVMDGVISCAAALAAVRLAPAAREYLFPSHCSAEPAGPRLLEAMGFSPLITAGMCLGEGTGGALAAVLLDCALAAYRETAALRDI